MVGKREGVRDRHDGRGREKEGGREGKTTAAACRGVYVRVHKIFTSAGEAKTPRMEDGASLDASERIMWAPSCSSPVGLALCVSSELCICSK